MSPEDVMKKITGPSLPPGMHHRATHVAKLSEVITGVHGSTRYKLVMLCAPVGYGKTTLLVDVSQQLKIRCCWYILDETDQDKTTLLKLLVLSIRRQFPNFGQMLDPLLENSSADQFEAFIDALTAFIRSEIPEGFVLFLCNYHAVNPSQGVNTLLNYLLMRLPSQCVLVMESRAVPTLDFASLFARNEVIGFDYTFLRFTPAEVHALADKAGLPPLKEKEAEQLTLLFEGWIAGILLGTRLGDGRLLTIYREMSTPSNLTDLQIDRQNLFAYIVNEVFSRDLEMYAFLKDIAILTQISPSFCNALLCITDAAERLHSLAQQGFFITKNSHGRYFTYTCHPVLRELLCDQVQRESPERFLELHQRAVELYRAAQDFEHAIQHALVVHLDEQAAHLILEVHEQMFAQGQMETLARWIDALPASTLACYPRLLVTRANVHLLLGEYSQAHALLACATESLAQVSSSFQADEIPLLQAKISITQGNALFQAGEKLEAQRLYQQILERVPAKEVALQAEVHTYLGMCANGQGEYTSAVVHFQKALQLWGRGQETYQTATLHNTLARTYCLIGNFSLAEHHLERAARCWERLSNGWGRVNNLLNMGMVKQRQGKAEAAEECFQEALRMARQPLGFRRGEAYALANLGMLYQEQAHYTQSLAATEEALTLAHQLHDHYLIYWALGTQAMTYLLMDDTQTAALFLSEAGLSPFADSGAGFETVSYDLTCGMILLRQGQFTEATTRFSTLANQLQVSSLRDEWLQATLRLGECLLVQELTHEAVQQLDAVVQMLPHRHYARIVQKELRLLPRLAGAITTLPALAQLQLLLHTEVPVDKKEERPQPERSASSAPVLTGTVQNGPGDSTVLSSSSGKHLPAPEEPLSVSAPTTVPGGKNVISRKTRIKILALGEPAVLIDNKLVTRWRMGRTMELLFLLLDHDRPLHREQIINAFWPEADESSINQTLNSTVYYLRKILGEACIVSDGRSYKLDLPALYKDEIWYDVHLFQEWYTKARKALESKDEPVARAAFSEMVDLYHGDYVQSFYSDWCIFQRDKLRIAYLDARQHLAHMAWQNEQFDESILHWQHILAIDSCLEEAHSGLIRCYIRQDKRGLALRQYQRCAELLRSELAIEPGPELQNLYQHLLKSS